MQASRLESDTELPPQDGGPVRNGKARRDLLVAVLLTLGLYFLASSFDLNEAWVEWAEDLEEWELDELPIALSLGAFAFGWYAYRRWREYAREARLRTETTERLRKEVAERQANEQRYREIFEESPIALWEEDWSPLKRYVEELAAEGVTDWQAYFREDPARLAAAYDKPEIVDISRAIQQLFRAPSKTELKSNTRSDKVTPDEVRTFGEIFLAFMRGKTSVEIETLDADLAGNDLILRTKVVIPPNHRDNWSRVFFAMEDVTERRQAEEALRVSEQRYREVFDESPVALWDEDWSGIKHRLDALKARGVSDLEAYFRDHRDELIEIYDQAAINEVSEANVALWRASNKEALIEATAGLHATDSQLAEFGRVLAELGQGKTSAEGEWEEKTLDGESLIVRTRYAVPPRFSHDWSRVLYAMEDVTEQRRAEAALQEGAQRYREIFDESPIALWDEDWSPVKRKLDDLAAQGVSDLEGYLRDHPDKVNTLYDLPIITDISRAALPLYGAAQKEALIGETHASVSTLSEVQSFIKVACDFAAGRFVSEVEAEDLTLDDQPIIVRTKYVLPPRYRDDWSRVLYSIEDVTEQRRSERALKENEERLRSIFDNSPNALYLKDLEGRFLAANQRLADWFGKPLADIIGETSEALLTEEVLAKVVAHDREVVETLYTSTREYEVSLPDGSGHILSFTKFPVFDADRQAVGVGGIGIDVTTQRVTEERLHQSQKMEAVGQLTGGIAHDFNNLLAVIMGNAEFVADEVEPDDGSVQAIIKAASRGAELTDRLLAFSRKKALQPQSIAPGKLVDGLIGLLSRTLGESITISTSVESEPWKAMADPGQVENAILNLAINARDAMPDGGALNIVVENTTLTEQDASDLSEARPGDYVKITVRDSGHGMTPEVLARVFEPFFTTKGVGEGSGLGLSMVYGFARQSGGQVTIDSAIGEGTTVALYLPRAREIEAAQAEAAPMARQAAARGEVILVLEDDPDVRSLTERMLKSLGYQVRGAANGQEAIGLLQDHGAFDLMLSDVVLAGGMTGPDVAEQARVLQPDLKVVFMSGYAEETIRRKGALGKGAPVINKPFHMKELAQTLRDTLESVTVGAASGH